jgi:hypothetical protein
MKSIIQVALITVLVWGISACSRTRTANAPTIIATQPSLQPTRAIITMCTLLDCTDTLYIELIGKLPDSYIVKVTDQQGQTIIVHCLWGYTGEEVGQWFEAHRDPDASYIYKLDAPETGQIRAESPALDLCESGNGFVYEHLDYSMHGSSLSTSKSIVIQCFGKEPLSVLYISGCYENKVMLDGFAPDELVVTLYWNGITKVEEFTPHYAISRPNGPRCEPECRRGWIRLKLTPTESAP